MLARGGEDKLLVIYHLGHVSKLSKHCEVETTYRSEGSVPIHDAISKC